MAFTVTSHFAFLRDKFRDSLGVKSAAEAVPAELMRRIFEVRSVAGDAAAGLHYIAQNFGDCMTIDSLVCVSLSLTIP